MYSIEFQSTSWLIATTQNATVNALNITTGFNNNQPSSSVKCAFELSKVPIFSSKYKLFFVR